MTPPEDQPEQAAALHQRAEELIQEQSSPVPDDPASLPPEEIRRKFHALRVHQIELELQNEELRQAQAEIEAGRERFIDLYNLAPVGHCTLSAKGMIKEANLTAAGLLGIAQDALVNQPFAKFIFDDDQDSYYQLRHKLLKAKGTQRCELRVVREGTLFWVRLDATIAQSADDTPGCFLVITDISERKKVEDALLLSEERFRLTFDRSPAGTLMVAPDFYFLKCNDSFCRFIGYAESELQALTFADITHPEERQRDRAQMERLLAGEIEQYDVEKRYLRKNGETVWARVNVILVRDTCQNPLFFLPIIQDTTERRQTAEALRLSEERHRMQFELAMDGILLGTHEGIVTDANRSMCAMLGMEGREFIGKSISELPFTPESLHEVPFRYDLLEKGEIVNSDRTLIRPDGTRLPVEMRTGMLPDGTYQSIIRDITNRKEYEERLTTALAEKDVLLREIHHRVKNNLAAIISLLDMQRRMLKDPQGRDILAELSGRIRSMSLIHEKLYRADNLARIDFQQYLQSLISHLRTSYGSPGIQCQTEAQGVVLPLDFAVPCGMIVNELVTNALKYAFPHGQPAPGKDACRIRVEMRLDDGHYKLTVIDNGVGLPSGFDWSSATTLGMVLVRMLGGHQLGGNYAVDQRNGLRFTLTFSELRGKK